MPQFFYKMYPTSERRFLRINKISIISLFVLILAGGIVRSTGSGMGCPDWPKCFDRIVPPTNADQLPSGYKDQFVEHRVEKNNRFARSLDYLGFADLATRIREDKSILEPEDFNAAKTWTEYLNRLVGAVTGIFLLGCAIFSVTYLKSRKRIFLLSFLNLFLVGFQAWLGSIVVSTNLLSWVVTLHMMVAILILGISIYTWFQAQILRNRSLLSNQQARGLRTLTIGALILSLIQIAIGTEVREQIDFIANSMAGQGRDGWVEQVGFSFLLHRDLAIGVIVINGILFIMIRRKYFSNTQHFRFISYILILILIQILTGISLSNFALPPFAQTVHLLLATLIFAAQYYLLLIFKQNRLYK